MMVRLSEEDGMARHGASYQIKTPDLSLGFLIVFTILLLLI